MDGKDSVSSQPVFLGESGDIRPLKTHQTGTCRAATATTKFTIPAEPEHTIGLARDRADVLKRKPVGRGEVAPIRAVVARHTAAKCAHPQHTRRIAQKGVNFVF